MVRLPLLVGAVVVAGSAGCSVPTNELPHPGTCGALELVDVVPAPEATDVPGDVTVALTFSDFPDPDTIDVSTVTLFTGFYYHTGTYWVDLVDRRALYRPTGTLAADLGYTLVVQPQIRSLRGCKLQPPPPLASGARPSTYNFHFQIAASGASAPPSPPPPAPASYEQVIDTFARHCAGSSCHLDTADGQTTRDATSCLPAETAGGRLSLCFRDARNDLVGGPSVQIARLVRVAARDSSRSYLLRKLIGAPPVVGHLGVPGDLLSQEELRQIQSWIDTGAPGPSASPDTGASADAGAPADAGSPSTDTPDAE